MRLFDEPLHMIITVWTIWRLSACCWFPSQSKEQAYPVFHPPIHQHKSGWFSSETSASRAVMATDAAGKRTAATTLQLIELQICLFLAGGIQNCGQPVTATPRLMGYIKASAFHILKRHIQTDVSFSLSVAAEGICLWPKVTKKPLEAEDLHSPLGSCWNMHNRAPAGLHTSDLSWEKMVHLRSDVSLLVFIRTSVKGRKNPPPTKL